MMERSSKLNIHRIMYERNKQEYKLHGTGNMPEPFTYVRESSIKGEGKRLHIMKEFEWPAFPPAHTPTRTCDLPLTILLS